MLFISISEVSAKSDLSATRTNRTDELYNENEKFEPLDSVLVRNSNGTLQMPYSYDQNALNGLNFRDTLFYNPLFLPMVFNGKILPTNLHFYDNADKSVSGLLIKPEETFAPKLKKAEFVNSVRRNYYKNFPDRIKFATDHLNSVAPPVNNEDFLAGFNPFLEPISSETSYSLSMPSIEGVEIKRKYWVLSGVNSLQFSQSYFSDNWHKGGTSNLNINSHQELQLNYRKNKVRFNNTLEWRLSVFNAPEDTLRKYSIGQDLIRYFGDYGIDAFIKRWSYSANLEVRTQFFNNYAPNSHELRSSFLAPLYVNAGIGLKYDLDKKSEKVRHRRIRMKVHLAPISVNFKYVANDKVDVVRFGIDENKKTSLDFGSTVIGELIYDFNKYITWTSRLKYFTSYHNIESEFENTLNMAITNAFSTRLYLNMRFDDSVPPDPKYNHLQINEMLSFGLNYKW